MSRIAFFGMEGRYSSILLSALTHANLVPYLVVEGVPRPRHALRGVWYRHSCRGKRWPLQRLPPASAFIKQALNAGINAITTSEPERLRRPLRGTDVMVVAGFPRLLPASVLSRARLGGLNVHPGALPNQRGPSALFWQMKAGRTALDVTVHMLAPGEDTGDIVGSVEVKIEPGMRHSEVLGRCAERVSPTLIKSVRALVEGDLVRTPQRGTEGRCPRPSFRDGLLDAQQPAETVYNFVRAFAHAQSLFVECGGDRFFIEDATGYDPEGRQAFEYALTGDHLVLSCEPGVVELRLKPEGALFSAEYNEVQQA